MFEASALWPDHQARSVSFENPTGGRGSGGRASGGRKGAPARVVEPGESVQLVDIDGPGCVTHIWMTVASATRLPAEPSALRAMVLEVSYDGSASPSVSVPVGDFFGLAHGVATRYASRLTASHEGSGFTSRIPMPFVGRLAMTITNRSAQQLTVFYQVDILLGPLRDGTGFLHAGFRRENPTQLGRDFVITDGWDGPGRFLGVVAGVRLLSHPEHWWGEGEVKMYFDGEQWPTICGTGTEDYLDSAWGLGTFDGPETGAPLVLGDARDDTSGGHRFVGMYRWHLSDPIPFRRSLRVCVQQIGTARFVSGQEAEFEAFRRTTIPAGATWQAVSSKRDVLFDGLFERRDDWSATAFVYCARVQPVAPLDVAAAAADLPTGGSELFAVRRPGPPAPGGG